MARRALERLELLACEAPGLAPYARGARVAYHHKRGEHSRAVECGERYAAAHPPAALIGWSWIYGVYAFSLLELRQYARALEVTERAYAALNAEEHTFAALSGMLEVAHAAALALNGQRERATALIKERIERMHNVGDYADLTGLYQYIVRMAYLLDDRAELERSILSMREAALRSGVSTAILLADRIAETYATADESASQAKPAAVGGAANDDIATATVARRHQGAANDNTATATATVAQRHQTALATFFTQRAPGIDRCREALGMLARCMASDEAYLYVPDAAGPQLLATIGNEEPPQELLGPIAQALNGPRGLAPEVCPVFLRTSDAGPGSEENTARYRIVPLPSDRDSGWVAAVALRDHGDIDAPMARALLEDVGRLVALDSRTLEA